MAAVNTPTDTKIKEKDINQKLQLYGVSQAFARGKAPSNKQVDVALNSLLASPAISKPSANLSQEGKQLVADVEQVIKEAKYLLLSKNEGNLLQDFIWQCQHVTKGDNKLPGKPTDKQSAQQHGQQALDGLKTLGTLLITNGQFRKLLKDATVIMRSMAGDGATKAAGKVNPKEEQMAQIDKPAEDNTWVDAPDMSREKLRNQVKSTYDKQKPFGKFDLKKAANDAEANAQQQTTPDGKPTQQAGQAGAKAGADALKEQASANMPAETKKRGKELAESTKNYLNTKMPKERREQTIFRLKKMVSEIQGHADYQKAIETLLDLAETYAGHGRKVSQEGKGSVKGVVGSNKDALSKFKTLIERFANCTSTEDFFDSVKNVYADAERDPELKNWFKSINSYIRKCLKEQGYIMQPQATEEFDQLYNKGNFLLRQRYRDHTNRVVDEVKFLGEQFDQDARNKAFAQSLQKLFRDLGKDENGKPAFKKNLIEDLSKVILPAAFEHIRYVPIPRLEVKDPMIDVVVENLVIESNNLAPNALEFSTDNYFRWARKPTSHRHDNKLMIAASGIQMDLRDVSYYIKKKQGFPALTDQGLMDIFLGGEGFSFKIAASNAPKKEARFAKIDRIQVDIKNLNINLKESKFKALFSLIKPILFKVMRPAIQKVLEKQIRQAFNDADAFLYSIHRDAEKAMKQANENPDPEKKKTNMYQQYVSAFQRKMTAKKEEAQKKKKNSNSEFKMAMTQHDSLFPDVKLPSGVSSKATEFKNMADKGEKWESPVFSIGQAEESKDIPKLAPVTRKPHNASSGGVRSDDGQSSGQAGTGAGGYSSTNGNQSGGFLTQVEKAFNPLRGQSGNTDGSAMRSQ